MVFLREVSFSLAQKPKVKIRHDSILTKVSPQDAVMAEFEDRYRGTSIICLVRRWGVVGLITKNWKVHLRSEGRDQLGS